MTEPGDSLGDRMKRHELACRTTLTPRVPVILRVDGKAFHTLTRSCDKPFDVRLAGVMNRVAVDLCEEIQGAQLAFVQSDEVSVLVHGYETIHTQPWFGGEVQKMVSVSAAVATRTFNAHSEGASWMQEHARPSLLESDAERSPRPRGALFDSRVFLMPEDEVCNYFIWRQQDATRNSIQMVARAHFSHRDLHGKSTSAMHEMLHTVGVNWDAFDGGFKRGRCIVRQPFERDGAERSAWLVEVPPIFTQDRDYIERHVLIHKAAPAEEVA